MEPFGISQKRVGILGGGQLSQMLCAAAQRIGLDPWVLTAFMTDPAAKVARRSVFGRVEDPVHLVEFFRQVDTVIFENEFVDCALLGQVATQRGLSIDFRPNLPVIAQLQDKLQQKHVLAQLGIPSAPFMAFESNPAKSGAGLTDWIQQSLLKFAETGAVFKWAKYGYDGKGTFIVSPEQVKSASGLLRPIEAFCQSALSRGAAVFVEQKVKFVRELAMVGCFSTQGEFATYPLVISEQEQGICKWVQGPAVRLGVADGLEAQARIALERLAKRISLIGSFAVEFFETASGEIWVNEIAPRVHNSGHYSLDFAATSQFENHWRAVLGLPLGATEPSSGFLMLNLLGPAGISREAESTEVISDLRQRLDAVSTSAQIHWYGKNEIRGGRKLGHINAGWETVRDLTAMKQALGRMDETWQADLLQQK